MKKKTEKTNYGFDLTKEILNQSEKDWVYKKPLPVFGSRSPICIAIVPENQVLDFLPKGEVQRGTEDTMDCVTRAYNNILETKLNFLYRTNKLPNEKWFLDNGYITENGFELSDAFISIISGTTREGNSLKAPIEAIRKNGCIPKKMLPLESNMTFDDYQNPKRITSEMFKLGEEFLKIFKINYDKVSVGEFDFCDDFIVTALYAWGNQINGEYQKIALPFNHSVMKFENKTRHKIFDNYIDSFDGDFIKKLAPDYEFFDYGFRVILSKNNEIEKLTLFQKILEAIKQKLGLIGEQVKQLPVESPIVSPISPVVETLPEKPKYLWDTKENVRHSIRVICDEMGLLNLFILVDGKKQTMKDVICACIQQESQFNPKAISKPNKDGTRDWGLVQINDGGNAKGEKFWIGKGKLFKDTDEVLNDPEKGVRFMARETKRYGYPKWWSSYMTGAYKKYL